MELAKLIEELTKLNEDLRDDTEVLIRTYSVPNGYEQDSSISSISYDQKYDVVYISEEN